MDIHYAVDHGVNLSLRPGDRSSMGSSAPRVTAQYVAQQHKQMAGFQAVKDPAEAAAPVRSTLRHTLSTTKAACCYFFLSLRDSHAASFRCCNYFLLICVVDLRVCL